MEQELASIKKPGTVEKISREEFEHRIKCMSRAKTDIAWWAENFFRIVSMNTGLGLIKLYDKQKELLQHLVDNDRSIVLASRQVGKTTCYTVFCVWLATLFPEKKIMICANKLQTSIEIMDRIRIGYEYLPQWIKPGIVVYNKQEITFSNKSTIRAFATSSSASRGFSGSIVVIDEMAFIPKNIIDEFFASVMPVVSSAKNSKAIIVSTPNGTSGLYYDIWQQANAKEKNKNAEGWKPFRIDWFEVPGRTQEWKEKQIASIGIDRWNQEFGNEFITSSGVHKLMPDDLLEQYRMKYSDFQKDKSRAGKKSVILSQRGDKAFEFTMWHEFRADRAYLASADIAEGVGGDDSVLYIWDVTDLRDIKMCAMFASNIVSLVEFAYVCSRILGLYGNPFLFAERNGVSGGMLDSLNITYGYPSIAVESRNGQPGIYSHVSVKGKACIWAREMLTTNGFGYTLYDKELIEEFGTFVKKDNKGIHTVYESPRPAHDDHVMAWIWGQYPLQTDLIEKYFIVTETFTSELGQTYPRKLAPLNAYKREDLEKIGKDPIYRDFVEFRESHIDRIKELRVIEQTASKQDIFKYTEDDMYFGGDFGGDFDGPSWNTPSNQRTQFNPNNHMPVYFI